jgi:hypothetical protein
MVLIALRHLRLSLKRKRKSAKLRKNLMRKN